MRQQPAGACGTGPSARGRRMRQWRAALPAATHLSGVQLSPTAANTTFCRLVPCWGGGGQAAWWNLSTAPKPNRPPPPGARCTV